MKVKDGQIIAVVGHVGSGKSSLMAACLGELERLKGSVTIKVGNYLNSQLVKFSILLVIIILLFF